MKRKIIFLFFLLFLFLLPPVVGQLPKGLLVAQEYNAEMTRNFLLNVSFLVAFVAGIMTLLSPCILPLVPAFFSYTFKEKKKITLMTVIFFLGFTTMFMAMGLVATFIGVTSLSVMQEQYGLLIQIAGVFLVLFGIMSLLGKGFAGVILRKRTSNDIPGVFLYGLLFALGWTVCIGPILAGILSMVALFHNYLTSMVLMFSYSMGMFVPLFFLSYFYDTYHLEKKQWIQGKEYTITIAGKSHTFHTTNSIAGMLFIGVGIMFIVAKGTAEVNGWYLFGLKNYFYSIQRVLLEGGMLVNVLGIILILGVLFLIYKGLKQKDEKEQI